jgi:hypothetical protein
VCILRIARALELILRELSCFIVFQFEKTFRVLLEDFILTFSFLSAT